MSILRAKSPIAKRRWSNFRANRRAWWSTWIFAGLLVIALFADLIANDKPLFVWFNGGAYFPVATVYAETEFGGEFQTEAVYDSIEVQCLIISGGLLDPCLDDPESVIEDAADGIVAGAEISKGRIIMPLIPFASNTVDYNVSGAPTPPDSRHWLGTDDQTRDVLARVIYGIRISIAFALVVVVATSILGVAAGAAMGYYGGWVDLFFQRILEIWGSTPSLYVIIIMAAIFDMTFWLLTLLVILFGWTGLTGLVRAEFLRARNFEYVRAARALGVNDTKIMFRHLLPNAMVATLTFLPFSVVGAIGTLTALDFLGFGLPPSYPSLGELALQAKNNLQSPHLAFAAFFSISILLTLLIFIFEGVRDAFDPRKTFK